MRIVYVDDDELLLQVAKVFLEASGYEVTCVSDPRQARETVVALDPDMVLLDVMMPEMDGVQTLQDLQSVNAVERAPVVFVTGDAGPEDRSRLLAAGGAGVIGKPFTAPGLRDELQRVRLEWRAGLSTASAHRGAARG